jgi:hypothetical protein
MHTRSVARVSSALVLGVTWYIAGVWIHRTRHALGREGFLASQAQHFDTFYANPHAIYTVRDVLSAIVFIALIIVLYELLAFSIYKLTGLLQPRNDAPEKT